jgi:hypothetical protein
VIALAKKVRTKSSTKAFAQAARLRRPAAAARASSRAAAPIAGIRPARAGRARIHPDILAYNAAQAGEDRWICDALAREIHRGLPQAESKVWHRHPVWFLDGNPIVGYSKLKGCIRLLFWSGQSFDEPGLTPEGSFKAAEARFTSVEQIPRKRLARWLAASIRIQWDYKNIVKRRGTLVRL